MIERFWRWEDKMAVLSDHALRDELRRKGIRIVSDLTNRQAALVAEAKKNGKFGYIRKGELVVEDRRPSRTKAAHRQKCNDQTIDIFVTHPPSVMSPSATATLQPGVTVLVLSTSVDVTLTTEAGLHWANMRCTRRGLTEVA